MAAANAKDSSDTPVKHEPTEDEIRDILADAVWRLSGHDDRPTALSVRALAEKMIGFDPSQGKPSAGFGGKSPDAYFTPFISMGGLRRLLDGMVEQGVLAKVTDSNYFSDDATKRVASAVRFPHGSKVGYVLADMLADSLERRSAAKRDQRRDKLRAQAAQVIAEKYAAEVTAVYEKLCAEAGLDPIRETKGR